MKKISIVSPFYNEENNVRPFFNEIKNVILTMDMYHFEFIAVNDGSKDGTLSALLKEQELFPELIIVDLSRNFGKEAALTAGIEMATGDAVIPIDSDLQHPPKLIPEMINQWEVNGYDVVLAKRMHRNTDSYFYGKFSSFFYRFIDKISDVKIPKDVGDFRLMDRVVVDSIKKMQESRRFMKGIFAWVGYRSFIIPYEVMPRYSGRSSFNFWRSWNFAIEGITSFSTVPLRIWTYVGSVVSLLSFFYAIYIVLKVLVIGADTPGFSSIMTAVLFFGGLNLVGIGVIGEYVGRTYIESKRRPSYIIRAVFSLDDKIADK